MYDFMREVKLTFPDKDARFEVASRIHEALCGEKDYIDSKIILHIDDDEDEEFEGYPLRIWFDEDCTTKIDFNVTIRRAGAEEANTYSLHE